jgi:UDP-GlcNAc:undecaprenyl-phosphate GlcNAc-1-phosphate transferase
MALVLLAALLGALATVGARALALRLGVVSAPDPFVAQHTAPIAMCGGVAIAAATAATLGLDAGRVSVETAAVVGALLFLGTGLLDDVRGLAPLQKLALQVGSASVAVALGMTIPLTGNRALDAAAAVVWIVVIVNAVNLTDVCDGLVAGLGVIALVALAAIGPHWRLALVVVGACLGFLVFNAPRASIFLGDAGSHFVGFALAAVALDAVRDADSASRLVATALVLGVPLFELVFVILVRAARSEPWWQGSADHFSLRLQAAGLSRWQTDAVAWTAAAGLALVGWSFTRLGMAGRVSLVALVVGALIGISQFLLRWDADPAPRRPA